jgi:hypothetical protein
MGLYWIAIDVLGMDWLRCGLIKGVSYSLTTTGLFLVVNTMFEIINTFADKNQKNYTHST